MAPTTARSKVLSGLRPLLAVIQLVSYNQSLRNFILGAYRYAAPRFLQSNSRTQPIQVPPHA